jgi:hypothetical protein
MECFSNSGSGREAVLFLGGRSSQDQDRISIRVEENRKLVMIDDTYMIV